jgi:hypothetical protein
VSKLVKWRRWLSLWNSDQMLDLRIRSQWNASWLSEGQWLDAVGTLCSAGVDMWQRVDLQCGERGWPGADRVRSHRTRCIRSWFCRAGPSLESTRLWVGLSQVGQWCVRSRLAFLNFITKNRITPTNSNGARNDMVIINLSLLPPIN